MSLLADWLDTAKAVITDPNNFFTGETRRDGFGYPLRFAALSIVITSIISAVTAVFYTSAMSGFDAGAIVLAMVAALVIGIIGLFIGTVILHIFVYLLGGKNGYRATLAVFAYVTALSPLSAAVSIVPLLGELVAFLISLYGVYLGIKGIENFQDMTTERAAIAVILSAVLLFLISIVLWMIVFLYLMVTGPGTY